MHRGHVITLALAVTAMAASPLRAQDNTYTIPHVLEKLDAAIGTPAPAGLSATDAKLYAAETTWLKSARTRINATGVKGGLLLPPAAPPRTLATSPSAARAIETLRGTLMKEGAKYDAMTGAAKARHDVAMNAIRNMKA